MTRALRPHFVNITWGAGSSTATKSLELAEARQRQPGPTTVLHLTCTNMSQAVLDEMLEAAKGIGIRNIPALWGDPPRSDDYHNTPRDGASNGAKNQCSQRGSPS